MAGCGAIAGSVASRFINRSRGATASANWSRSTAASTGGWFEDRGPQCTLLVFVDDATSRLMHLQFVESESTFAYFHAARAYLEAWGKPVAFYSGKHGCFGSTTRARLAAMA